MDWLQRVAECVALEGPTVRVLIVETSGPTPRAAGAAMLVTATGQKGRIGRGEVEHRAVAEARALIAAAEAAASLSPLWQRQVLRFETGLVLGERSEGTIVLLLEVFAAPEMEALRRARAAIGDDAMLSRPLEAGPAAELVLAEAVSGLLPRSRDTAPALLKVQRSSAPALLLERIAPRRASFSVYGTGLVARALVRLLADLPFEVTWLDTLPGHFPADVPQSVNLSACPDMAIAARLASPRGFHAVMTAAHELDLAVCRSIVSEGSFRYLGVIGSQLKRERLSARLSAEGCPTTSIERISCPIGLPQIRSKTPSVIAVAIAAEALMIGQADIE